MTALTKSQLAALAQLAHEVCDEAEILFRAGVGSRPVVFKGKRDFATAVDLAIESLFRERLEARSGLPVLGEEGGGTATAPLLWVVDPIDGTNNYSAGLSLCAILVALLEHGRPVLGITAIPLLNARYSAIDGEPLLYQGVTLPLEPEEQSARLIAVPSANRLPTHRWQLLHHGLVGRGYLPRISGSIGVDLAYAAQGILAGAAVTSPHVWDLAAGVALNRAAGKVVTDFAGAPWRPGAHGLIVGTAQAHQDLLATMNADPET